jgi:hypothetical protein
MSYEGRVRLARMNGRVLPREGGLVGPCFRMTVGSSLMTSMTAISEAVFTHISFNYAGDCPQERRALRSLQQASRNTLSRDSNRNSISVY